MDRDALHETDFRPFLLRLLFLLSLANEWRINTRPEQSVSIWNIMATISRERQGTHGTFAPYQAPKKGTIEIMRMHTFYGSGGS